MSKQTVTKEVDAVICDFCDKEIDVKSGNYCYHHLRTSGNVIEAHKYNVTHMLFRWLRINAKSHDDYVQYDFHAPCFDNLMCKFLAAKEKP